MALFTLLPFTCACACSDLKSGKIPNSLILCGLAGALLSRFFPAFRHIPDLPGAMVDGCAGCLLPWLCFGLLAALKMMGGGDVKLLSVIGLQLGIKPCLSIMWYSLLFGAAYSAVLVARKKNLTNRLNYLYQYILKGISDRTFSAYRSSETSLTDPATDHTNMDSSGEFCFAVPILCALLLVLAGSHGTSFLF